MTIEWSHISLNSGTNDNGMELGLISDWKLQTRSWWLLTWIYEQSPWSTFVGDGNHLSNVTTTRSNGLFVVICCIVTERFSTSEKTLQGYLALFKCSWGWFRSIRMSTRRMDTQTAHYTKANDLQRPITIPVTRVAHARIANRMASDHQKEYFRSNHEKQHEDHKALQGSKTHRFDMN